MNRYSTVALTTLEQNGDVCQILLSKQLCFSAADWGLWGEIQAMCWGQDLWNSDLHWGRSQTITWIPTWISSVLFPGTYPLFISTTTRYQKLELIIAIIQREYLRIPINNLLIFLKQRVQNPLKRFRFRSLRAWNTLQESVKWWISVTESSRYNDSAITFHHSH